MTERITTDTAERPEGVAATDTYITRVFAAPRDVVFRFWQQPELFAEWWGPVGYSAPAERARLGRAAGERYDFDMVEDASGHAATIECEILELVEPELIALQMTVSFSEGAEPFSVQLRVQFHDHGDRTRVTLHQGPFAAREMREGNEIGWGQSFDKLDAAIGAAA
jgi:uncharacterized protein YndB with AHSA1/START domain